MNADIPESNDGSVADQLAKVAAFLKYLDENPPTEEEIREGLFNSNPFDDIARSLSEATEITAALEKIFAENLPPRERVELADAKALIERRRNVLLQDWNDQLNRSFPASN